MKADKDPYDDSSVDAFGHYHDGELAQVDVALQGSVEPLSAKSVDAINRLARYKPPPDPYPFPEGRAAVLVCLFGSRSGDNLNVILSTRSETLRTYPGQVALPGGKMDDTDINLEATARREAFEEIGLPIDTTRIRYLTALPPFLARSMMLVTPVVCLLLDYTLKPEINPSEVAGVFSFPLEGFLTSSPTHPVFHRPHPAVVTSGAAPYYTFEDYPWFDGRRHRFHSFETSPQAVTGLTAEILIHVAMLAYAREPEFPLYASDQRPYDLLVKRALRDPRWDEFRRRWRERKAEKERASKL
ncbi:hypothetical protein JCM3775_005574 [Rhodotorula graminis]|uniref:Nudix hydrolase domain-containing protein n=1 Tax=Rhodotorula graminis (strain WP1) TaxID=578459 RepID=A0A194SAM1_RHOGW|nr:uncharacterized protein RHOBADRAFT_51483 [Rhodotorula graminis WP1]KPV77657.1 hypothetical protein RHOBADRAFT_51483 [Rhodotorula graminis WP1]